MTTKKLGRPFSEEPKNVLVAVRLTEKEKVKLDQLVADRGINVSDLIRGFINDQC